jgi:hypothetical protein
MFSDMVVISDGQFRVVSKGRAKAKLDKACFYIYFEGGGGGGGVPIFKLICWEVPPCTKNIGDGPIKCLLLKKKK